MPGRYPLRWAACRRTFAPSPRGHVDDVQDFQTQREILKSVATTLKAASIPFALAGGYAVWARGGQESTHDVDFVLTPDHADAALGVLVENGHDEFPSNEDWLDKVSRNGVVVDIIHRLPMGDVDDALLGRCDDISVDSVVMPVMSATDLLLSRILAFSEHSCDFGPPIGFARSLREQVDWEAIRSGSGDDPFARAFLMLLAELGVVGARQHVA